MGSPAHGRYVFSGPDIPAFLDGFKLFQVRKLTVGEIYDVGGRDIEVQVF